jgi:hypothetical protein
VRRVLLALPTVMLLGTVGGVSSVLLGWPNSASGSRSPHRARWADPGRHRRLLAEARTQEHGEPIDLTRPLGDEQQA